MREIVTASSLCVVTPSMPTHGAYTAGKIIGGLNTLDDAARQRLTGVIQSMVLADKAKQDAAVDVVFFRDLPTGTFTDGGTWDPSAADLLKIVGVVSVVAANYSDGNSRSVATVPGIGLVFEAVPQASQKANDAKASLWCVLVSRGTPTYADGDLQLSVGILQD